MIESYFERLYYWIDTFIRNITTIYQLLLSLSNVRWFFFKLRPFYKNFFLRTEFQSKSDSLFWLELEIPFADRASYESCHYESKYYQSETTLTAKLRNVHLIQA